MTVLGIFSSLQFFTYKYALPEILLDVYLLTVIISLLPKHYRKYVFCIVAAILYSLAIIDNFCYLRFKMPLRDLSFVLLAETNGQETGEFFKNYVSWRILFSRTGILIFLGILHFLYAIKAEFIKNRICLWLQNRLWLKKLEYVCFVVYLIIVAVGLPGIIPNYYRGFKAMTASSQSSFNKVYAVDPGFSAFLPVYRGVVGWKSYRLSANVTEELSNNARLFKIQSCTKTSRNIVFIIGESANCSHSELYGYNKPTTPWQSEMMKQQRLWRFDDMVTPWNLTHYALMNIYSTSSIDSEGEWYEYPLFPELFRQGGYTVTLLENQYVEEAGNNDFDVSIGSFLTNPKVSDYLFNYRTDRTYQFDGEMVNAYKGRVQKLLSSNSYNLIIYHLKGLHFQYFERFTKEFAKWSAKDYSQKRNLSLDEKTILSQYDNAMLYDDAVIRDIVEQFNNDEVVVVYLSDHGEEVYPGESEFNGRNLSDDITRTNAEEEYRIPFWVYTTEKYSQAHPDIVKSIEAARSKPFMSDDVSQMLMYLAGIKSKWYNPRRNIISSQYKVKKRILRGHVDYDKLVKYGFNK